MTLGKARHYGKTILGSAALAALLFFIALAGGCRGKSTTAYELSGAVMGTTYHVKIVPAGAPPDIDALAETVQRSLEEVDDKMSTYKPDSELSRFNRHATAEAFPLSAETRAVFDAALRVSRETGGAFDVTVGPLVNAWGFGPDEAPVVPDAEALEELLRRVGYQYLELGEGLAKARIDLQCDLSAIAKGYGVDQAAQALDGAGVLNYMVEVGGEVKTRGRNASGVPWRIAIEKPVPGERAGQRIVGLDNIALATSGDYRNFYTDETGRRRGHTIDPRTGYPVTHTLASVSVFHQSCALADAYATALMVLGPEEGRAFAEEHGLAVLFLVRDGDTIAEVTTPAFDALF